MRGSFASNQPVTEAPLPLAVREEIRRISLTGADVVGIDRVDDETYIVKSGRDVKSTVVAVKQIDYVTQAVDL